MSPPKPPLGPPNDPFTDPLSGSEAQTLSAGDNFTPRSNEMTNQNADIGIGKPPPDASYYDYNDGGSNLPIILMGIGAVLITAMIAGLVYLAYMKGLEDGQSSMPPLIMAEEAPVKTPPPDEITSGRPEEGGLSIYDELEVEDIDASTLANGQPDALSKADEDVSAALDEDIHLIDLTAPECLLVEGGRVKSNVCFKMELGENASAGEGPADAVGGPLLLCGIRRRSSSLAVEVRNFAIFNLLDAVHHVLPLQHISYVVWPEL